MRDLFDTLLNGPSRWTQQQELGDGMTLVVILGALAIEIGAACLLFMFIVTLFAQARAFWAFVLRRFGVGEQDDARTFLQLTFPSNTTKSAYATEQLHVLLHGLMHPGGFWGRWAGRKLLYSLELVASRDEGIRYVMMVPASEGEVIKSTVLSYLPGLKVAVVEDYLLDSVGESVGVRELKLTSDFILPLTDVKALEEHDHVAYLSGHMRNLGDDEIVAFQIVATPVLTSSHHNVSRRIVKAQHRIALSKELSSMLSDKRINVLRLVLYLVLAPVWVFIHGLKVVTSLIEAFSSNGSTNSMSSVDARPAGDPYEQELGGDVKQKLDQHMFEVSMRILVVSPDASAIGRRISAVTSSFQPFTSTRQSIRLSRPVPVFLPRKKFYPRFQARQLTPHVFTQQTILSASELSDLYHFPNTNLTKTDDLVKSRSKDLPVPLSQKNSGTEFDVVVGANEFAGETQDIGLTLKQRQKHTYVIGKTGTGKTTMLMSSIYQDMMNGKGVAVFDPHGDMFRELLSIVPRSRRKDVVVFDPSDRDHPVGLNILDPGIDFVDKDDKEEWITSSVLSVFAKLSDEKQWGPRMEHILRNTTLTALQTPKPSLYTLQRLLTDKKYQKEVAKTLDDPVLKQFWDKEFKMMGSMQMSNATAPLTHRLGHFITAKMSRHILLQETSTLRIADIMDESKILLINLSKGDIGEDQSFFFGTILTSFIWMAAYQRTKIPEAERKDFFVYVDEFQNFATPQFGAITSEGRKFHIGLVLSHQSIAQIEDKNLLKVITGNVATIISLKSGPEDETFILPHMKPEVEKGDIVNLAPYHFYMKVSGDESEDAFSGVTVPVGVEGSESTSKEVVKNSRKQYASAKGDVEEYLEGLFDTPAPKKSTSKKADAPKAKSMKIIEG